MCGPVGKEEAWAEACRDTDRDASSQENVPFVTQQYLHCCCVQGTEASVYVKGGCPRRVSCCGGQLKTGAEQRSPD